MNGIGFRLRGRAEALYRRMAGAAVITGLAFGLAAPAWGQAPDADGRFYGDGDVDRYPSTPYAVSENGSKLYVTLVNRVLYVALVVDRSFNDNVFDSAKGTAYLDSAGWGNGGNTDACRRMDSEYAEFSLTIGEGASSTTYNWQQGYAGQSNAPQGGQTCNRFDRTSATWISDETVSGGLGTPPDNMESASSLMWNLNNYALTAGTRNWTMPGSDTDASSWKSPWRGADGSDNPPLEDTSTVIDANEGYPPSGQITYSETYQWEWSMIYEWSVDMSQFGANPVFVVTGSSHHSPSKLGPEDDEFPPQEDPPPLMDFGDLPQDGIDFLYPTRLAADGARHAIDTSVDVRLGANVDTEPDASADTSTVEDDQQTVDDEDGVELPGSSASDEDGDVTVYTSTVTATNQEAGTAAMLCAWFDMDQSGTFDNTANSSSTSDDPGFGGASDSGERSCVSVPDGAQNDVFQVAWTIPENLRDKQGDFYFRYRFSTDPAMFSISTLSTSGRYSDGEVEDYQINISTLPVSLNSFSSRLTGNMLRAEWTTASETFVVGFDLWAKVQGEWQLLTAEPVLSTAADAVTPQEYETRVVLRDIDPNAVQGLALSSIETNGDDELYGSFEVGRSYGERSLPEPIDWKTVRSEHDQRMRGKGYTKTGNKWIRSTVESAAGAAAPLAVDVQVAQPGMQRVTYEALLSAGLDLSGERAGSIAVTLNGESVPRVVDPGRGQGGFGPGGHIDFWGVKPDFPDALYLSDYVYRIEVNSALAQEGVRVMRGQKTGQTVALEPEEVNEDNEYSYVTAAEDPWYAAELAYPWGPRTYTTALQIDGPLAAGQPGRLEVVVAGFTSFPDVDPDHRIRVSVNGEVVMEDDVDGLNAATLTGEVPVGLIEEGRNEVVVELPGGTAAPFDMVTVDRVTLWYPRRLEADGNRLHVRGPVPAAGLQGSGFTAGDLLAYARTPDDVLHELRVDSQRAGASWTATVPTVASTPGVTGVEYWISTSSELRRPRVLGAVVEQDLLSQAADYLLIVHPSFLPDSGDESHPLNRYMAQRESQGWRVRAVALDAIQNAYGGGMALPGAVTKFLAAADEAFDYSHVLLVGDDSYDYLDKLGLGSVSFVPTVYTKANVITHSPSDGLLTDLDGDGLSDKAVGRWPVRTLTDLEVMVDKTLAWEDPVTGPWDERTSVWVTDSEDPEASSFQAQAERMIDTLRTPLAGDASEPWPAENISRVYFDQVTALPGESVAETARGELMEALSQGQTVTGFVGHGSPVGWTFQGLLKPQHVAQMDNEGRPTLIATLTCYTSYFVSPNTDTLAHRLMKGYRTDAQGEEVPGAANGAVAVHGAATLSSYTDNERLARRTLEHQLEDGATLGEAIRRARAAAFQSGNTDTAKNWALLGDPTLIIRP